MNSRDRKLLAEAYIAEKSIERTQRYVVGGRRFESYTIDALEAEFCTAYRRLILHDDDGSWDEVMDFQSEFALRRLEAPMHLVAADFALFKARLDRVQRVGPNDPVAWYEVRDELIDLRERLSRPKH